MNPQFIEATEVGPYKELHPEIVIDDRLDLAIDELFDIDHPAQKDSKTKEDVTSYEQELLKGSREAWGQWVYYPWLNRLVHFPPQDKLRALRTSRNRNLITPEEQAKLYEATILVVGMSVGSNIVEALISQGIGGTLILVDMDVIEPSNLNRIRSPYYHVGLDKVEAISRKVWEIDPYIKVVAHRDGLHEDNLPRIIADHHIDVIVDEMDELRMKILLREAAKQHRLPVVMAADDGDNALIDIERYDIDTVLQPFAGRIPTSVLERIKQEKIPRAELGIMIGRYFVGADNIPLRMYQSLREVGKTLPSWPQLGGAAALSGIALAYAIRKILLGADITSGRRLVAVDEKIGGNTLTETEQKELASYEAMMGNAHEEA